MATEYPPHGSILKLLFNKTFNKSSFKDKYNYVPTITDIIFKTSVVASASQINNNIKIVEAGAQGEHKLQRGYVPTKTWSAHWIKDKDFSNAIENFLNKELNLCRKLCCESAFSYK